MSKQPWYSQVVNLTALGSTLLFGRPPQRGTQRTGEVHFKHDDWNALLRRFVQGGEVDYSQFKRVRRILEAYLDRIAHAQPDTWTNPDEQLAFYLNAHNAIVVHQVLLHAPIASFQDIPAGFTRPYPVGRENMSLLELAQNKARAFRDPRVHMALVHAARSSPILQSYAYSGPKLQNQLAEATRVFLSDEQRGVRYEAATHTLYLSALLRWFAGDWSDPEAMPNLLNLLRGQFQPQTALPQLRPWLPEQLAELLDRRNTQPRLAFMPYDWSLNSNVHGAAQRSRAV